MGSSVSITLWIHLESPHDNALFCICLHHSTRLRVYLHLRLFPFTSSIPFPSSLCVYPVTFRALASFCITIAPCRDEYHGKPSTRSRSLYKRSNYIVVVMTPFIFARHKRRAARPDPPAEI